MGKSVICAAASAPAAPIVSVPVSDACCDLLELFAGVSDGRVGQGRDHPVAAVLALAAAAVVAGMKGYTAITGWVADVPPAILADLHLRSGVGLLHREQRGDRRVGGRAADDLRGVHGRYARQRHGPPRGADGLRMTVRLRPVR